VKKVVDKWEMIWYHIICRRQKGEQKNAEIVRRSVSVMDDHSKFWRGVRVAYGAGLENQ
jgi:hypothetical protein